MRQEEAEKIQPVEEDSVQISKRKRAHEHTDTTPYDCGNMIVFAIKLTHCFFLNFFFFFYHI